MTTINVNPFSSVGKDDHARYRLLWDYYSNNALYNSPALLKQLADIPTQKVEAMKPLRTPVNRVVNFYTSKVASGNPKISAPSPEMEKAITSVMNWSNFEVSKQEHILWAGLLGIAFKKVVSSKDKVWQENLNPSDVTQYEVDNRGFITEIRIDTVVFEDDVKRTRTEYWTLDGDGYMAVWVHGLGKSAKLDSLGEPNEFTFLAEFGIDFIPIVITKFKKLSGKKVEGCVDHALLKIDEANRMATRLHQMQYRYEKELWAVTANAMDKDGRPLPAPRITDANTGKVASKIDREKTDILYLPGNSDIKSLIPDINYADALAMLQAQEKELQDDLPELRYYTSGDSQKSGLALRILLSSAIDRATEFEDNFIRSQVRINMMCLTIGSFLGIFANFGSFDRGELQHTIQFAPMFPISQDEKATALAKLPSEMPLAVRMELAGYEKSEILKAVDTSTIVT